MELQGIVHNGVIVPDDPLTLVEGTRVVFVISSQKKLSTFGERYAEFKGAVPGPTDLAAQHEHYRLGTPKR